MIHRRTVGVHDKVVLTGHGNDYDKIHLGCTQNDKCNTGIFTLSFRIPATTFFFKSYGRLLLRVDLRCLVDKLRNHLITKLDVILLNDRFLQFR